MNAPYCERTAGNVALVLGTLSWQQLPYLPSPSILKDLISAIPPEQLRGLAA